MGHPERRAISVTLDPRQVWAEVGPYKARGLLLSVNARPIWLANRKAWSVSYEHGQDVLALAQHLRYDVTVVEAERAPLLLEDRPSGPPANLDDVDHPDVRELDLQVSAEGALW